MGWHRPGGGACGRDGDEGLGSINRLMLFFFFVPLSRQWGTVRVPNQTKIIYVYHMYVIRRYMRI